VRLRIDELASLWTETPTAPMQVSLLLTLEPTGPDPLTAEGLAELIVARAEHLPALHRRIRRNGPHGASWVPDHSPDSTRILLDTLDTPRHPADTAPAVWRWAADRAAVPLPGGSPPWRALIAADGGRLALLVTAHHALVDGAQGLGLVHELLAPTVPDDASPPAAPHPPPASVSQVSARPRTSWRQRLSARRATTRCVLASLTALRGREPDAGLPRTAGRGRSLDVVRRPLDPVRQAARERKVTITDAVLAAVTSALRDLCAAGRPLRPGLTLRAIVPIAQPGDGQARGLLVAPIPVGEPDPACRLAIVAAATAPIRALVHHARRSRTPSRRRPSSGPPPMPRPALAVARRCLVGARRWGEARVTVAVTTLHGPALPWRLPGATVTDIVPIASLSDRVRVSVTALSYADTLTVAVHTATGLDPRRVLGPALGHDLDRFLGPAPG
jgi:diacylglycerol O-acyltransferase